MANKILAKQKAKSVENLSEDGYFGDSDKSIQESLKSSSKSNDSDLAYESLQNKDDENDDRQDNDVNGENSPTLSNDNILSENHSNDNKNRNNKQNHNADNNRIIIEQTIVQTDDHKIRTSSDVSDVKLRHHNNGNRSKAVMARNLEDKSKVRHSLNLTDNSKLKGGKSMLSKIMKRFGVKESRWELKNNNEVITNIDKGQDKNVVLKNMNYNLSYKKEKRQRRPRLMAASKLQIAVKLYDNENLEQFNDDMKMFGVKFDVRNNFIESVALDGAKVTFLDELRDSELSKKNKWLKSNLLTYVKSTRPNNAPDHTPIIKALRPVVDYLKKQNDSPNSANITTNRPNKSFFGTSLTELSAGNGFHILKQLIEFIKRDCSTEGIFRIGARHSKLNTMKKQIDELLNRSEKLLNIIRYTGDLFSQYSSIELAAVLKIFLRELPEPLIPQEFAKSFLTIPQVAKSTSQKIRIMNLLILALPQTHATPLRMVLTLLNECSRHVDKNKMTIEALALIISPNIFPDTEDELLRSLKDNEQQQQQQPQLTQSQWHIQQQQQQSQQLQQPQSSTSCLNLTNFANIMDHTNNSFHTICLLINLVEILFHFPLDVYKNII